MSEAAKKRENDLSALKATVETTESLIQQLLQSAKAPKEPKEGSSTKSPEQNDVNAIDLAHDSASLIKAHATKLSLLIINKPFTASAITKVLRDLVAGPLPGLASAVEICNAAKYTKTMSEELQWRVKKVLSELDTLVHTVPLDGNILSDDQKNGTGKTSGKGSLASTGVVWDACDSVMALKTLGVAGLAIKRAEEYRDLLKDALEELQGWAEEDSDEENDAEHRGDESDGEKDAQDELDDMFGSQRHIPKEDPEKIRERLESSLKKLRLLILMYQAVVKRRFKTLPYLPHPQLPAQLKEQSAEDPGIVESLDEVLVRMKKITNLADDLASAFYDLDCSAIDKLMDETWFTGFATVALLINNWEGQKDEFSTWAYKFQLALKKGW